MFEIRFDAGAFANWIREAGRQAEANARQTLGQGVALALEHARQTQLFNDRTGELRRSIIRGQKSTWVHFLKATAPYAKYVEGGTKPHRIEAKRRGALRFVQHGEIRFRRGVNHPGTKPRPFMDEAATVGARFLDWRMEDAIARAFR
jgi:hypothetical protein